MLGEVVAGRYRVTEKIGEGGHGSVWRADDLSGQSSVALKVMHEQRDPGALSRFTREAELVRRLSHPNNVRLLDFGVHDERLPFSAFELLAGETLQQRLKREGALPLSAIAHVARQTLSALAEAHAVGIVHRDIKPANLFLVGDSVKVIDYGIAKSLRPNTKALTRQGEVLGTPSYMTPELIEARPITPSSDLYALGLVMSELLSGRRVYQGSPIDICLKQVSPSPTPLPEEVTRSPLGPVIARATEKDPARRFSTAEEMLAALDQALDPAAPEPAAADKPRLSGTFVALLLVAAVAAVAVVAALVWL
ncbi:MAG: serine/threonine protein kinase [Polyangiaceae bacterium]|nr:serine/threonine protein kinase [Polyangiaceae bacterium]